MDPEKFDRVLLDVLYEETDEVTRAAAERHMSQSERARRTFEDLRAAREVGRIELVDAPEGLHERIMAAERDARAERSLGSRLGGLVSLVASYTMRPQLAMAALLMLMLGSSLLLLRARPGAHDSVLVTERGVPEAENESIAIVPVPKAPGGGGLTVESPRAQRGAPSDDAPQRGLNDGPPRRTAGADRVGDTTGQGADGEKLAFPAVTEEASAQQARAAAKAELGESTPFNDAMLAYREGRYDEARQRFDEVSRSKDPNAATAELFAARATKRARGCGAAMSRFETVAHKHVGEAVAHEALWESAECHRESGSADQAERTYRTLLAVPSYEGKARQALASMARPTEATAVAGAAEAAPPSAKAAASPARRATDSE